MRLTNMAKNTLIVIADRYICCLYTIRKVRTFSIAISVMQSAACLFKATYLNHAAKQAHFYHPSKQQTMNPMQLCYNHP